jgi:hypothetical protein
VLHPHQPKQNEILSKQDLPSLVEAGEAVSNLPAKASASVYPLTTKRALALGVPSAFSVSYTNLTLPTICSV